MDQPLLGGAFLSINGHSIPKMPLQAVGIYPLMLPEFRKQGEVVHFHRGGLEWHGVEKIFLNVGQSLGKPRLAGHGLDDLIGLSHSWSVIYKWTFQSQQVTTIIEFSFPSPLPFNFSSWHLEMFPIIGSYKQRHEVQAWEMLRKHLPASCSFILDRLPGAQLILWETAIAAIYLLLTNWKVFSLFHEVNGFLAAFQNCFSNGDRFKLSTIIQSHCITFRFFTLRMSFIPNSAFIPR